MRRIICTSYGLTTSVGRRLIGNELKKDDLTDKRIFLFHEPHYSIVDMLVRACVDMGFKGKNIVLSGQQKSNTDIEGFDYLYVTEGNTFEVLSLLRERDLDSVFVNAFQNGATYIGASAGALIGGVSIEAAEDFDKNFVRMSNYKGLGLYDGIVISHYTKSELKRYIKNSPGIEDKYNNIYSVSNEGIFVLEV